MEWLGHVHMVARNCWHPALHSNPRVLSIPFGKKKKVSDFEKTKKSVLL